MRRFKVNISHSFEVELPKQIAEEDIPEYLESEITGQFLNFEFEELERECEQEQ